MTSSAIDQIMVMYTVDGMFLCLGSGCSSVPPRKVYFNVTMGMFFLDSADVHQRQQEKARLEKAYKECDHKLNSLVQGEHS